MSRLLDGSKRGSVVNKEECLVVRHSRRLSPGLWHDTAGASALDCGTTQQEPQPWTVVRHSRSLGSGLHCSCVVHARSGVERGERGRVEPARAHQSMCSCMHTWV
eukprot:1142692-Pelagomonas_calceolata.AAC.2